MANNLIIKDNYKHFKEHALIEPPEISTSNIPKRFFRYVIDSRDRNLHYYKNPNKYEIKLSQDIHDVQSVELISFDVPFTKYLINEYNNTFYYIIDDIEYNFIISIGDYVSGAGIVDELNTVCTTQGINLNFTFSEINKKISVTSTIDNVNLSNRGNSISKNNYEW